MTVGEVTPTVYIKDSQHIIDESIQKSEVGYPSNPILATLTAVPYQRERVVLILII